MESRPQSNGHWTRTTLDGFGRTTKTETGDAGGTKSTVDTVYDSCGCNPMGKMVKTSMPYAPNGTVYWKQYTYDGLGRTVSATEADGTSTTTYAYLGNTVQVTDPAGKWKKFTMDAFGNLTSVLEPDPLNQPSGTLTTTYAYDILNHLTTVTMPRATGTQTRTFNYTTGTTVGTLLLSATNPENGTVTYTYNTDKTLATKTDAMNQQFSYTYDSYKRVTQINLGQTVIRQFYYDTNPLDSTGTFSQYANGRLTAVQNAPTAHGDTFIEMYSYTQPGGIATKRLRLSRSLQTGNLDASYTYDNEGKMTSVTYPQSWYYDVNGVLQQSPPTTYTYGFDTLGRPTSMTGPGVDGWTTVNIVSNVQYGPASEMLQMSYFGSTETRQYNTRLQMTHLTVPGQLNISYNFPSANNGQTASQTDNLSGEQITYQYDALKRLYSATGSGWSQSFTYDGFGNLTDKVGTGTAPTNHSPVNAATNQLTGNGYYYDANGNLITTGYGWDPENRMSYANSGAAQYAYDSANKRVWAGNFYCTSDFCDPNYSSGWQLLSESIFFYGIDGKRLASYTPKMHSNGTPPSIYFVLGEERVYFKSKYIGNADPTLNSGGTVVGQDRAGSVGKYFPYGEERNNPQLPNGTVKFATYTRDSATGLDYADQRYYTSGIGRFMSPDPSKGNRAADPSSWNKYTYAQGDPVNFNDPAGLATCTITSVSNTFDPDNPITGISTAEVSCISVGMTVWTQFSVSNYDGNWKQLIADSEENTGAELDSVELWRVVNIAMGALSERPCADLFGGSTDPGAFLYALFNGLVAGSSLGFGDLDPPSGGLVTAAETLGILDHQVINGVNTAVFTGATITINNNGLAPWAAGYLDRFGIGDPTTTNTQDIYRAITIIHELGHYYNTVTGMGGSTIANDIGSSSKSQDNSQLVFDHCFASYRNKF